MAKPLKYKGNINGFTLVELAVVIIIIALLIAAVVGGKNLVTAGKMQAVISENERYQNAISTFYNKYNDLPGDITTAYIYWGDDCATGGQAANDCNGNGNELVEWEHGPNSTEGAMAWKHLELAGMIAEGGLSGEPTGAPQYITVGTNVPGSTIPGAGWIITTLTQGANYTYRNHLFLGAPGQAGDLYPSLPVLTSKEAFSIDSKLDDGYPVRGRVQVVTEPAAYDNCRDASSAPGSYILEGNYITTPQCVLMFQLDVDTGTFCAGSNC